MDEQQVTAIQEPKETVANTEVLPVVEEKKESNAGRPTVMTPEVLESLRQAFLMGCTDVEACLYANIGTTPLYEYQKENPEFKKQKEQWKENPTLQARKTVFENIGDKQNAQWYLERKAKKEFSPRQEVTGEEGKPLSITFDPVFNEATRPSEENSPKPSEVQDNQSGTQGGQDITGSRDNSVQSDSINKTAEA